MRHNEVIIEASGSNNNALISALASCHRLQRMKSWFLVVAAASVPLPTPQPVRIRR